MLESVQLVRKTNLAGEDTVNGRHGEHITPLFIPSESSIPQGEEEGVSED